MLGGGPTCIVIIHPPAWTGEEPAYVVSATTPLQLSTNAWQPLPLVSSLGIDLLYAKPDQSQHPLFTVGSDANTALAAFTMDCDPASASFGKSRRTATGGVAFNHSKKYIDKRLSTIKSKLAGPDGVTATADEYGKLGPQAFKVVFERYRAEQVKRDPGMGWEDFECPVTVAGP
ncbi:hypothetical protein LTS14_006557 [Recurvomyces mirabilis]|uniref:uncharacterized protein n=1 Tax=Recurvomyces mirabilis TaxID=574656 RepID=UPI002DE1E7F4|nr:hypothetical protein LTS14_006557 [Recurvomyces mirabilis]